MTSLVTPAEVKALVKTSLADGDLQSVIDRIEGDLNARIGAPQDESMSIQVVKRLRGEGPNLFLPTEIYSVVSIVEDDAVLDVSDYRVWGGGVVERLPMGSNWGQVNEVTYKPADDRLKRKAAIIDLARIYLNRTAMKMESVGNYEYSYNAPENWEVEINRVVRRLTFKAV